MDITKVAHYNVALLNLRYAFLIQYNDEDEHES